MIMYLVASYMVLTSPVSTPNMYSFFALCARVRVSAPQTRKSMFMIVLRETVNPFNLNCFVQKP